MAGNIKKASVNSPRKIRANDRCMPHPGQSNPKSCLFIQGIMYFSKSKMLCLLQFYKIKINFFVFKGYYFKVLYFWNPIKLNMKKLLIPVLFLSGFVLLYEQSKDKPNVYIITAAIVVFMFGLMKLNTKIPHKNNDKDQNDVQ